MVPSQPPPKPLINLLRGWPSPDLLPAHLLSAAAQRVLSDSASYVPILQYGPDEGYMPLREALAAWLSRHYGVGPDPRRICITGGASQNLACVLQKFTDPLWTRAVWMVAPCYHLACAVFEDAGFAGRLRAVPEDEDGMNPDVLEEEMLALEEAEAQQEGNGMASEKFCKTPDPMAKFYRHVVYCVPTCANPSGKTMSVKRREALLRVARKHDALIVCDDVYDFLQWPLNGDITPERPQQMRLPRLCDIERGMEPLAHDPMRFGHSVSNGSFSKIAGPGVRTGWAEASPAFATGLGRTGSTRSGGAPSQLAAAMLSDLVRSGELESYIDERTRPALQRRHHLLMDIIQEHIVPLGATVRDSSLWDKAEDASDGGIYGGYFVWFSIDSDHLPAKLVADVALREENLIIGHGSMFEVHGNPDKVTFPADIRLCFSWEPEADIVEGVKRLAAVIRRIQVNKSHYEQSASAELPDGVVTAFK